MRAKVFIGSSKEGLDIAYAVQQNLSDVAESTVWSQGIFELSKTAIESLDDTLGNMDFAIFVFNPDDITLMRGTKLKKVRDNVLFELGLFIGRLNRDKVFIIAPQGSKLSMPSDLLGVTIGMYENNRIDSNLLSATGAVCNSIRVQIKKQLPTDGSKSKHVPEIESEDKKVETITIEKETEKNDKDDHWTDYYLKGDLKQSKEKIEIELKAHKGQGKTNLKIWINYIDLKIKGKKELNNYMSLSDEIQADPELIALALSLLSYEYPDEAISLAEKIFQKDKMNVRIGIELANLYINHDHPIKARDLLLNLNPEINPDVANALAQTHPEKSPERLDQLRTSYLDHQNNKEIKAAYATALYNNRNLKEALYLYDAILSQDPNNISHIGMSSNVCLELGLYDMAMIKARKANELSKGERGWILQNIGNLLKNKGFYTDAIEWLKKGLEVEKDSTYAYERLASSKKSHEEEQERYDEICNEGRKLIKSPSSTPASQ